MKIRTGKFFIVNTTIEQVSLKLDSLKKEEYNPDTVDTVRKIELNVRVPIVTVKGSKGYGVVKTYVKLIQQKNGVTLLLFSDLTESFIASLVIGSLMFGLGLLFASNFVGPLMFAGICFLATLLLQFSNAYSASHNLLQELKKNYL